jgi:hypothetical protein
MSRADAAAMIVRNQATLVARTLGAETSPGIWTFEDDRLRIAFDIGNPHAVDVFKKSGRETRVFGAIFKPDDGDSVTVIWLNGSWQASLKLLAEGCA